MARKTININTLKHLFALSGNECAHPNCTHPIFNDEGLLVAQLCHIEAANEGGARYNKLQTDDERANFNNLLFLCYRHHKESDFYSKEELVHIKESHESRFKDSSRNISNKMLEQIIYDIDSFWLKQTNKRFEYEDLKIFRDFEAPIFSLFNELETHIQTLSNILESLSESDNELIKYADLLNFRDICIYDNPFLSRNFETHSLLAPNTIQHTLLSFYQLRIKIIEILLKNEPQNLQLKTILS